MGIISWLVVGLIAGWLAGMVMKGGGYGVVGDIILGIIGAVVGGFLATTVFKLGSVNGINVESIVIAAVGAVIVVFAARLVMRGNRKTL
ncbi:MAG TPA: GlsB/YeaQ/YmgE family stress response membrane protein [Anaerolineae bacterium]|nr:GlsB/YeaQ/YmgE family stress response membrane protein [Anaerolineae bacterium]